MPSPFYVVQASHPKYGVFFYEASFSDTDADAIAKGLATGEYDTGNVQCIHRFNPDTKRMDDVSVEVLSLVEKWTAEGQCPSPSIWAAMDRYGVERPQPLIEPYTEVDWREDAATIVREAA